MVHLLEPLLHDLVSATDLLTELPAPVGPRRRSCHRHGIHAGSLIMVLGLSWLAAVPASIAQTMDNPMPMNPPEEATYAFRMDLGWDGLAGTDEEVAALHEVACSAGYEPSCSPGAWRSPDRMVRLHGAAIALKDRAEQGDPLAAVIVGVSLTQKGTSVPLPDAIDPAKGLGWFLRACDAGFLAGCEEAGRVYRDGTIGQKRPEEARRLLKMACDGGYMRACTALGESRRYGSGGLMADAVEATKVFKRACDGGDMTGCSHLGVSFWNGDSGVSQDYHTAVTLFQRACSGGDMYGCNGLAVGYENGTGELPREYSMAIALYRRACDGGNMNGCNRIAHWYDYGGLGLVEDDRQAVAYYRRVCDGGDMLGCGSLGGIYMFGRNGISKDVSTGIAYFEKACYGDELGADCTFLGMAFEEGWEGLQIDAERAIGYYKLACLQDDAQGCWRLSMAEATGFGTFRSSSDAAMHATRACELGWKDACSR